MDLINRTYEEGSWAMSIPEEIANGLILTERLSAPRFRVAINSRFHFEGYFNLYDFFDAHCVQDMATAMIDKVPQQRVIWQFLVDECCSAKVTVYAVEEEDEKLAEGRMPKEFLLRCMRRFRELVKTPQQGQEQERCYLEHSSAEEKEDCPKLHMRYDEATRHGHFE
jgi:hypothetical protein